MYANMHPNEYTHTHIFYISSSLTPAAKTKMLKYLTIRHDVHPCSQYTQKIPIPINLWNIHDKPLYVVAFCNYTGFCKVLHRA